MELTPVAEKFIVHWGEMGSSWGVNRTMAQIHALLYLAENPMTAEEIAQTLSVARSNVSTSLRELQSWKLVRVSNVLGDRRDYFESHQDVWELFKLIVAGRKQREIDPTLDFLTGMVNAPDFASESRQTQQRIQETQEFIRVLTTWTEEMLRQDTATLMKILKMGAKISALVRSGKDKAKT